MRVCGLHHSGSQPFNFEVILEVIILHRSGRISDN